MQCIVGKEAICFLVLMCFDPMQMSFELLLICFDFQAYLMFYHLPKCTILQSDFTIIRLCPGFIYLEVCGVAMVSSCHTTFSLAQPLGFFWSSFPCPSFSPPILRFRVQGYSESLTASVTLPLTHLCSIIYKLYSH